MSRSDTATDEVWRLGDIDVGVTVAGEGERVVLIHGLAQDRSMWTELQSELDGVETLAYDVRGHGTSSTGGAEGTLAQLGEDLVRLLEHWGAAACVGFSLGGTVALWAAGRRPALIPRLAVLGTSSVVGSAAADFYAQRIELIRSADREQIFEALEADTAAALVSGDADVAAIASQRVEAIGSGSGYCNGAEAMMGLHGASLSEDLARIDQEVLVIGGERDAFCPRKAADIMLGDLPNASYCEIADAGHLMTIDQPAAVRAELQTFLDQDVDGRR